MKKIYIFSFICLILFTGCGFKKTTPEQQNVALKETGFDDSYVIEKDVYITKNRDVIYYGIDVNASDKLLTFADLPKESSYEKGVDITPAMFSSAELSPYKNMVAFSVKGKTNSYEALYDISTKKIEQLTILKKSLEPGALYWSPDGKTLVAEDLRLTAQPVRFITLIGVSDRSLFTDLVPPELTKRQLDVYNPVWSFDSKFVTITVQDIASSEITKWKVDAFGKNYEKVVE